MLYRFFLLLSIFIFCTEGFTHPHNENIFERHARWHLTSEQYLERFRAHPSFVLNLLVNLRKHLDDEEAHIFLDLIETAKSPNLHTMLYLDRYTKNVDVDSTRELIFPPSILAALRNRYRYGLEQKHFPNPDTEAVLEDLLVDLGQATREEQFLKTLEYFQSKTLSLSTHGSSRYTISFELLQRFLIQSKREIYNKILSEEIYKILEKYSPKQSSFFYRFLKEKQALGEKKFIQKIIEKKPESVKTLPRTQPPIDTSTLFYLYFFWCQSQKTDVKIEAIPNPVVTTNPVTLAYHMHLSSIYTIEAKASGRKSLPELNPWTQADISKEFANALSSLPIVAAALEFELGQNPERASIATELLQNVSYRFAKKFGTEDQLLFRTDGMLNLHKIDPNALHDFILKNYANRRDFYLFFLKILTEEFQLAAFNLKDGNPRVQLITDTAKLLKEKNIEITTNTGEFIFNGKSWIPPVQFFGHIEKGWWGQKLRRSINLIGTLRRPFIFSRTARSLNIGNSSDFKPNLTPNSQLESEKYDYEKSLDQKITHYLSMMQVPQTALRQITLQGISYYMEQKPFASGNQAEVFRAWNSTTSKPVVIKQSINGKSIFTNILETQGAVESSSVIQPIAVSEDGTKVVLEYVNGMNLNWVVNRLKNRLSTLFPIHAIEITHWLATTLNQAAQDNVFHSDLKPDQILIGFDPSQKTIQLKLTDFSAKILDTTHKTSSGSQLDNSCAKSILHTSSVFNDQEKTKAYAINATYSHPLAPFQNDPCESYDVHAVTKIFYTLLTGAQYNPRIFMSDILKEDFKIQDTLQFNHDSELGSVWATFFKRALSTDSESELPSYKALFTELDKIKSAYIDFTGQPTYSTQVILKKLLLEFLEETYGHYQTTPQKRLPQVASDISTEGKPPLKQASQQLVQVQPKEITLYEYIQNKIDQYLDVTQIGPLQLRDIRVHLEEEVSVLDWNKDRKLIQDTIDAELTDYQNLFKPLTAQEKQTLKALERLKKERKKVCVESLTEPMFRPELNKDEEPRKPKTERTQSLPQRELIEE